MRNIRKMENGSAYVGALPKGCALCEKGAKLVLLVTGKCGRRCCYCPLSSEKRGKEVFFANERRVASTDEVTDEARLIDALGTGVTGGDPLVELGRTVDSIKALKSAFGKEHHIHLYTSTTDPRKIRAVARAGLDEIRFHPPLSSWADLEKTEFAHAVDLSRALGMKVGLELPVLPGRRKDVEGAIVFADNHGLAFVNLNELEFSETNWRTLRRLGYDVKKENDVSSGVDGSEELALELLAMDVSVPLHYCSSSFKDGVQLRRRIMRRAKNVRKPHEIITEDGTLLKGVIETDSIAATAAWILSKFDIPGRLVWRDRQKNRLEVAPWVLERISRKIDLPSFIVEEYPTADRLEVERTPLKRR